MARFFCIRVNSRSLLNNSTFDGRFPKYASKAAEKNSNSVPVAGNAERNAQGRLESTVEKYKSKARRSITIQVFTPEAANDVFNYCQNLGIVSDTFHYCINQSKKHFLFIEFKQMETMEKIKNKGIFMKGSLPVRSTCFSFMPSHKTRAKSLTWQNLGLRPVLLNKPTKYSVHNIDVSLSQLIEQVYNECSLTISTKKLRYFVACELENSLSTVISGLTIEPFGSTVSGFGNKECDLDVLGRINYESKEDERLIYYTQFQDIQDNEWKRELMLRMAAHMKHFLYTFNDVQKVLAARVPIIRFVHTYTNVKCDLSMAGRVAIHMTELLHLYGSMNQMVRPLVFCIRSWAEANGITSPISGHWITNFSLTLLVLFFLQVHNVLPSVNALRIAASKDVPRIVDDGIDYTFLRKPNRVWLDNRADHRNRDEIFKIDRLVRHFLRYYAFFDFNVWGISIDKGEPIQKQDVSPLFIQNPLEPHLNVSKNVPSAELERIKRQMHSTLFMLEMRGRMNFEIMKHLFGVQFSIQKPSVREVYRKDGVLEMK